MAALGGEGLAALAEVVEESRQIGIARVDLEPDAGDAAGIEPTGHQGRLARTRRSDHTSGRPLLARLIEQAKQPLARNRPGQARAGELGEQWALPWHLLLPEDADDA